MKDILIEEKSKTKHIIELSRELLDDIELSRLTAEQMLLKTMRLARFAGSVEIQKWLSFEMRGYSSNNEYSLKYMDKTNRWTKKSENKGYWMPLAEIESSINAQELKLKSISVPNVSGEYANLAVTNVTTVMNGTSQAISKLSGVRSRVIGLIHSFVTDVYYEKTIDQLAESIFESFKEDTDKLLDDNEVLQKIPSVIDRLSDGDTEAISHALTSCRRIIDSFADGIFPPSDDVYDIGGNKLSLKKDKVQNRINAYVHQHCDSKSRRKKFRDALSNLYDRVSTGVHNDINIEEAKALFLNTYLLLGEILTLKK